MATRASVVKKQEEGKDLAKEVEDLKAIVAKLTENERPKIGRDGPIIRIIEGIHAELKTLGDDEYAQGRRVVLNRRLDKYEARLTA